MNFIFDIDGTLTHPRSKMEKDHEDRFLFWAAGKDYSLVTGSDFVKILDQVPKKVLSRASLIFCCLGNEVYQPKGLYEYERVYQTNLQWPDDILAFCENFVNFSKYTEKHGSHIERRVGVLNVSTVGRKADQTARKRYAEWDYKNKERESFVKKFNKQFKEYEAYIGGMISVDITMRGMNKAQVADHFVFSEEIVFFGDRIEEGGNDHALAKKIEDEKLGICYSVNNPQETLSILEETYKD